MRSSIGTVLISLLVSWLSVTVPIGHCASLSQLRMWPNITNMCHVIPDCAKHDVKGINSIKLWESTDNT